MVMTAKMHATALIMPTVIIVIRRKNMFVCGREGWGGDGSAVVEQLSMPLIYSTEGL